MMRIEELGMDTINESPSYFILLRKWQNS